MSGDSSSDNNGKPSNSRRITRSIYKNGASISATNSSNIGGSNKKRKHTTVIRTILDDDSDQSVGEDSDDKNNVEPRSRRKLRPRIGKRPNYVYDSDDSTEDDLAFCGNRIPRSRPINQQLEDNVDDGGAAAEGGSSSSNGSQIVQPVRKAEETIVSDEEDAEPTTATSQQIVEDDNGLNSDSSSNELLEKCPICMLTFRKQQIGSPANCRHLFCAVCITTWSKNVATCPIDRIKFDKIIVWESHENRELGRVVNVGNEVNVSNVNTDGAQNRNLSFTSLSEFVLAFTAQLLFDIQARVNGANTQVVAPSTNRTDPTTRCSSPAVSTSSAEHTPHTPRVDEVLDETTTARNTLNILPTQPNERIIAAVSSQTQVVAPSTSRADPTTHCSTPAVSTSSVAQTTLTPRVEEVLDETTTARNRLPILTTQPNERIIAAVPSQTQVVAPSTSRTDPTTQGSTSRAPKLRVAHTPHTHHVEELLAQGTTGNKRLTDQQDVQCKERNVISTEPSQAFSLFGGNILEYFSDSDDAGLHSGIQTSVRSKKVPLSRAEPTPTSSSPNVLSSIMEIQDRWLNASRRLDAVRIRQDGSFELPAPSARIENRTINIRPTEKPTATATQSCGVSSNEITQYPKYPRGGGENNRSFNSSGGGEGGRSNYNNRYNNQSNYRGSGRNRNSGGGQYCNSFQSNESSGRLTGNLFNMVGRSKFSFSTQNTNQNNDNNNQNNNNQDRFNQRNNKNNNNRNQHNSLPNFNFNNNQTNNNLISMIPNQPNEKNRTADLSQTQVVAPSTRRTDPTSKSRSSKPCVAHKPHTRHVEEVLDERTSASKRPAKQIELVVPPTSRTDPTPSGSTSRGQKVRVAHTPHTRHVEELSAQSTTASKRLTDQKNVKRRGRKIRSAEASQPVSLFGDASTIRTHRSKRASLSKAEREPPSSTTDLLSNIMNLQDRWLNASRHLDAVRIRQNGSLDLQTASAAIENPTIDTRETEAPTATATQPSGVSSNEITQAPMYTHGGGGNNRNFNSSDGGGAGGGNSGGGNYNNRSNNQYRGSGGSGNFGGGQYHNSFGSSGSSGGTGLPGNFFNMVGRGNFSFSTQNTNQNNDNNNQNNNNKDRFNQRNNNSNNNRIQRNSLPNFNYNNNQTNDNLISVNQSPLQQHRQQNNRQIIPIQSSQNLAETQQFPIQTQPPLMQTQPPSMQTQPPSMQTQPPSMQTQPPPMQTQPPSMQIQPPLMHTQPPPMQTAPIQSLLSMPIQPPPGLYNNLPPVSAPPPMFGPPNMPPPTALLSQPPPNLPMHHQQSSVSAIPSLMGTTMSAPPLIAPPLAAPPAFNSSLFQLTADYGADEDDDSNCPNFSVYSMESLQVANSDIKAAEESKGESPKEDDENENLVQLDDDEETNANVDEQIPLPPNDPIKSNANDVEQQSCDFYEPDQPAIKNKSEVKEANKHQKYRNYREKKLPSSADGFKERRHLSRSRTNDNENQGMSHTREMPRYNDQTSFNDQYGRDTSRPRFLSKTRHRRSFSGSGSRLKSRSRSRSLLSPRSRSRSPINRLPIRRQSPTSLRMRFRSNSQVRSLNKQRRSLFRSTPRFSRSRTPSGITIKPTKEDKKMKNKKRHASPNPMRTSRKFHHTHNRSSPTIESSNAIMTKMVHHQQREGISNRSVNSNKTPPLGRRKPIVEDLIKKNYRNVLHVEVELESDEHHETGRQEDRDFLSQGMNKIGMNTPPDSRPCSPDMYDSSNVILPNVENENIPSIPSPPLSKTSSKMHKPPQKVRKAKRGLPLSGTLDTNENKMRREKPSKKLDDIFENLFGLSPPPPTKERKKMKSKKRHASPNPMRTSRKFHHTHNRSSPTIESSNAIMTKMVHHQQHEGISYRSVNSNKTPPHVLHDEVKLESDEHHETGKQEDRDLLSQDMNKIGMNTPPDSRPCSPDMYDSSNVILPNVENENIPSIPSPPLSKTSSKMHKPPQKVRKAKRGLPLSGTLDTNENKARREKPSKKLDDIFENLFGLSPQHKTSTTRKQKAKSKTIVKGTKLPDDHVKVNDDLPNSAVELQVKDKFLRKLNRQERIVEEVKMILKPRFNKKQITKDDYKEIMRRAVPKICHSRSGEINSKKIKNLIEAYVKKFGQKHKKLKKPNTAQVSSAVICAACFRKL